MTMMIYDPKTGTLLPLEGAVLVNIDGSNGDEEPEEIAENEVNAMRYISVSETLKHDEDTISTMIDSADT